MIMIKITRIPKPIKIQAQIGKSGASSGGGVGGAGSLSVIRKLECAFGIRIYLDAEISKLIVPILPTLLVNVIVLLLTTCIVIFVPLTILGPLTQLEPVVFTSTLGLKQRNAELEEVR